MKNDYGLIAEVGNSYILQQHDDVTKVNIDSFVVFFSGTGVSIVVDREEFNNIASLFVIVKKLINDDSIAEAKIVVNANMFSEHECSSNLHFSKCTCGECEEPYDCTLFVDESEATFSISYEFIDEYIKLFAIASKKLNTHSKQLAKEPNILVR